MKHAADILERLAAKRAGGHEVADAQHGRSLDDDLVRHQRQHREQSRNLHRMLVGALEDQVIEARRCPARALDLFGEVGASRRSPLRPTKKSVRNALNPSRVITQKSSPQATCCRASSHHDAPTMPLCAG